MRFRNKIILGTLATAAVAGGAAGIIVSVLNKKGTSVTHGSYSFTSAVNGANDFLKLTVTPKTDKNPKYQSGLGHSIITFNKKEKRFVFSLKSLFATESLYPDKKSFSYGERLKNYKLKLLHIGKGLGITGVYMRYHKIKPIAQLKVNSIFLPFDYLVDRGVLHRESPDSFDPQNEDFQKKLEEVVGVKGAMIRATSQAPDVLYDQDGLVEINMPYMGKDGEYLHRYTLSLDVDNPVLIDPIVGGIKKLEDLSVEEIKTAIFTQIIKFASFVDTSDQLLTISNVWYKDRISDPTLASFYKINGNDSASGSYLVNKGKAVEAIKRILKEHTFEGSRQVVNPVTDPTKLSAEEKKEYYPYDKNGIPTGVSSYLLVNSPYKRKPVGSKYTGIVIKTVQGEKEGEIINPITMKLSEGNTQEYIDAVSKYNSIYTSVITKEYTSQMKNVIEKHANDKYVYTDKLHGKKYNAIGDSKYSWLELKKHKLISSDEAVLNLINKKGFKVFGEHGYKNSLFVNNGSVLRDSKASSVGEAILRLFKLHSSVPYHSEFLKKLSKWSLFEKMPKAANEIAPVPLVSIEKPLSLGIDYGGVVSLSFVRNYRTSMKDQGQKIFTKDDLKKNIFGNKNVSDKDMMTFIYLLAKLYTRGIDYNINGKPAHVDLTGIFAINTGIKNDDLVKMLKTVIDKSNGETGGTTNDAPFRVKDGFVVFDKQYSDIEGVIDVLFNKAKHPKITIQDLGTYQHSVTTANGKTELKFKDIQHTEKTIDNPFAIDESVLQAAKQAANDLYKSDEFKKDYELVTEAEPEDKQRQLTPSAALQERFNKVFREVFLGVGNEMYKFSETQYYKNRESLDNQDIMNDYFFRGLDSRGTIFNIRHKSSTLVYKTSGAKLSIKTSPYLSLGMTKFKTGTKSINYRMFDIFSSLLLNDGSGDGKNTFFTGLADHKFAQLAAFIYLLDKFDVHVRITIASTKDEDGKDVVPTREEVDKLFGHDNIHFFGTIVSQGLNKVGIVELKLGSYKAALKKYIEYFYPGTAAKQIGVLDTLADRIDAAFNKYK